MARSDSRHSERILRFEKGFFYSFNVRVQGSCAGLIAQLPWNDGFGVLGRKLDNLQGFTPLLGVPKVILDLLTQPTFGAGVKRDG